MMDLRETILKEHSKEQKDKIVAWVGSSQDRFDALFDLFLDEEYRLAQRSAWPLSFCVMKHPEFINSHFYLLIKNIHQPRIHNAVKRNTMRLLQYVDIPEKYRGEVMDICFNYISSPEEKVSVKAFSLTILEQLAKAYPEIIPEVKLIIEDRMAYETAAFKSRAKRFLRETEKMGS